MRLQSAKPARAHPRFRCPDRFGGTDLEYREKSRRGRLRKTTGWSYLRPVFSKTWRQLRSSPDTRPGVSSGFGRHRAVAKENWTERPVFDSFENRILVLERRRPGGTRPNREGRGVASNPKTPSALGTTQGPPHRVGLPAAKAVRDSARRLKCRGSCSTDYTGCCGIVNP